MSETRTPLYELADTLLGGDLRGWVLRQRAAGKSWRRTAQALAEATDRKVDVTHETIRMWFVETNEPAA